jgi:hypothetical protein
MTKAKLQQQVEEKLPRKCRISRLMTCPEKEDSTVPICLVQSHCPEDILATQKDKKGKQIYMMLELEQKEGRGNQIGERGFSLRIY